MLRPLIMAAALAVTAAPAAATEWLYCGDAGSTVTLGLLLGHVEVLAVSGVVLSHGERVWASHTAYGPGEEVSVGQGFEDDAMMAVDLMDKDFSLLAEIRLFKADEGDMPVAVGGTLRLPGVGAWPIACSE